ncbi:VOC family protein [Microbulbifer sp. OS29]|uniref:VOC family protein n=1 Tax=Microbulbifer okhotskensis TaxID=2926617 RepID=A0A9X2ESQ4_9GAMM|nr:VOC family protein [Microbulbifer okhotskensis]MCO1337105.1 VOC family protein [Microbulbifer okhotskensis]
MFSHIMIGADDVLEAKRFYDAILMSLGHNSGVIDEKGRCFYFGESGIFAISKPINEEPASHANGGTIGFTAKNREEVDAWYATGIKNGGIICEDPPGIRKGTIGDLYQAYLRDPSRV